MSVTTGTRGAEQRDVGAVMLGLRDRMVAVPGSRHDPEAGLTEPWTSREAARPEETWFSAEGAPSEAPGPSALNGRDVIDDPAALPRALFWTALLLYGFLAPYVITAVSTAGDEHIYLLNTVSLLTDRDVDITNNAAQGDYGAFYWGRATPDRWRGRFVGFASRTIRIGRGSPSWSSTSSPASSSTTPPGAALPALLRSASGIVPIALPPVHDASASTGIASRSMTSCPTLTA